ncbi:MFS transporter [Anaeroselena agilis]|uniref:MFS transporter n=1 Tax=Anaeroselena agilis TaxID=3063788 RepID=A0ABU3P4R5_9FIRM|nr:MFS transporter [Selenomonadales bacterium 4137-cl]
MLQDDGQSAWQLRVRELERRRWLVWVPVALAFLAAYFHRTATGVVADSLMRDFAIERAAELGVLSSIYFYTYAAMQLPAGILADFWGPRRTVTLALLMAAGGAVLFGASESMPALYAGRFLSSVGVGLLFVNLVKIYANWFRLREFGTMSGLTVLVGNAGSLLAATPLAFVVEALNWRAAFYLIAAYSLVMAAASWLIVRDRPADVGLPPVAAVEESEGVAASGSTMTGQYSVVACIRTVLGNRYTWPPFLAGTLVYSVFMTFLGVWGVPYFMQVYGMSRIEASNYMVAVVAGNMVGGPLIGFLSDRLGYRRWPYCGFVAMFLAVWLTLTVWNGGKPPVGALYPLVFMIGVGMSALTISVACAREVNPPHVAGIAAGFVNSGPFIGAALMQPIFGWVLDLHWQGAIENGVKVYPGSAWQSAFWLCAAVLAVGLALTLLIRETRCRARVD